MADHRTVKRWTIAVDVDGVLHSYTSGWQGAENIPDPPVPGAIEWLEGIVGDFDVAICSTRAETAEGRAAIIAWLVEHGLSAAALGHVTVTAGKPPALIYLDDRAYRFMGTNWPTRQDVHDAKPWWQT